MIYITKGTKDGQPYELMLTFKEYEEQARIQGKIKEIQQKEKEMTNKAQPTVELVNGGKYTTRTGEKVTMTIDTHCKPGLSYHQFFGSNGFYYKTNGSIFSDREFEADIVSEYKEPQVQPKLYTEAHRDIAEAYQDGLNAGSTFTTSELQSLTKMQSKVIAALEAEILELKETAAYLGNCVGLVNRVNGLRKQIFNEITTKKKRLAKLVALQQRMKRSK